MSRESIATEWMELMIVLLNTISTQLSMYTSANESDVLGSIER